MALHRILLSALIALGLVLAPIANALASSQGSAAATMDCHGTPAKDCPCPDKAKCAVELCALKCYKLLGTLPAPPTLLAVSLEPHELTQPLRPSDRLLRPHPPPPRS